MALQIYLDEDVDVLLSRLLNARGHDCLTASELGHLGWPDERHLEWAGERARVLISHNRVHFEALARDWHGQSKAHAGIVLAVRRPSTYELMRRVLPVLALYDQAGWRNGVVYA